VKRLGRPLRTLDFGGGLGIPYFAHEQELNLECFRKGLVTICEEVDSDRCFEGTQFIVEPGRFLAGEAGVYLTRINDIKISRGKKFLIVDGGMNHHLAASGNLGQTIKRNYPIALVNKLTAPASEAVDGRSASPVGFLSHPAATEVWVDAENSELLDDSVAPKNEAPSSTKPTLRTVHLSGRGDRP
jgi:diaminopimelate decarboxylase